MLNSYAVSESLSCFFSTTARFYAMLSYSSQIPFTPVLSHPITIYFLFRLSYSHSSHIPIFRYPIFRSRPGRLSSVFPIFALAWYQGRRYARRGIFEKVWICNTASLRARFCSLDPKSSTTRGVLHIIFSHILITYFQMVWGCLRAIDGYVVCVSYLFTARRIILTTGGLCQPDYDKGYTSFLLCYETYFVFS